jgi:hypothetical protein
MSLRQPVRQQSVQSITKVLLQNLLNVQWITAPRLLNLRDTQSIIHQLTH